jgi:hypothetical protein
MTPEALFREVFLPLYPEDARRDLARARSEDANPAGNASLIAHLDEAARIFAQKAGALLGTELDLDFSDASVHRLDEALTEEARKRLLGTGDKGTAENALFNFVVHGAAYVGGCVVKNHRGVWAVRRPLWESLVRLESRAGSGELAVFHWWLKSLADPRTGTLADRYRAYVEVPCAPVDELPVIAPEERILPRLTKVRYDVFYKYLRANLPEMKDVGDDFPSPERFEEYGFKSLSFLLVGGGRMLVVHGATAQGLHAFWLTRAGFEKAAFWPCDAFPEPLLRKKNDKLEVVLSERGAPRSFELLWWGP